MAERGGLRVALGAQLAGEPLHVPAVETAERFESSGKIPFRRLPSRRGLHRIRRQVHGAFRRERAAGVYMGIAAHLKGLKVWPCGGDGDRR